MALSLKELSAEVLDLSPPFSFATDVLRPGAPSGSSMRNRLEQLNRSTKFHIRYDGLKCHEQSETWATKNDEVYFLVVVANLSPWARPAERVSVRMTPEYTNVYTGREINSEVALWGLSETYSTIETVDDVLILVQAMEHDYSNRERIRSTLASVMPVLLDVLLEHAEVTRNDIVAVLKGQMQLIIDTTREHDSKVFEEEVWAREAIKLAVSTALTGTPGTLIPWVENLNNFLATKAIEYVVEWALMKIEDPDDRVGNVEEIALFDAYLEDARTVGSRSGWTECNYTHKPSYQFKWTIVRA